MNAVSMTTRSLRDILRRAAEKDLGFKVCAAGDIPGPGGGVFIKARTELTERHLTWFEQRNPARGRAPTYVDVLFVQEGQARSLPAEVEKAAQPAAAARERRRRAETGSREVGVRAENVTRQAQEVFRLIGDLAFPESALRHPKVQANLQELDVRIRHFHNSVREALDEYLSGNTLIMDLISQYGLGSRAVQHGLNVAVLATEIGSQVLIEAAGGQSAAATPARDAELLEIPGNSALEEDDATAETRQLEPVKRELAEIFLGGFMHDCGLWNESVAPHEGHEAAGARLIHSIADLTGFLPTLIPIVLFHSDAIRLANRGGIVQVAEEEGAGDKIAFRTEFYRTPEDARTALRLRSSRLRAEILGPEVLSKVLPVALAEYCLTHREGFDAQSLPAIVSKLARHARGGLYERFAVALCNAQTIVPRRAYVAFKGTISVPVEAADGSRRPETLELDGWEGCSIGHGDDLYSPHLIVLFFPGPEGQREKLEYVDPRNNLLWGRAIRPGKRIYIAIGRHKEELVIEVTGFMREEVYNNVLGEYEQELRRQMQA